MSTTKKFTGRSSRGDVTDALKDALQQAENASSIMDALIKWKIEQISGERGSIAGKDEVSVTIAVSVLSSARLGAQCIKPTEK